MSSNRLLMAISQKLIALITPFMPSKITLLNNQDIINIQLPTMSNKANPCMNSFIMVVNNFVVQSSSQLDFVTHLGQSVTQARVNLQRFRCSTSVSIKTGISIMNDLCILCFCVHIYDNVSRLALFSTFKMALDWNKIFYVQFCLTQISQKHVVIMMEQKKNAFGVHRVLLTVHCAMKMPAVFDFSS